MFVVVVRYPTFRWSTRAWVSSLDAAFASLRLTSAETKILQLDRNIHFNLDTVTQFLSAHLLLGLMLL